MVLNSDAHSPDDLLSLLVREQTIVGAGLDIRFVDELADEAVQLVHKLMGKVKR
jgi:hypothetical protein